MVITGRSSRRQATWVVRELEWPARRASSAAGTPESDMRLTNEVRSSRGVQPRPDRPVPLENMIR